MPARELLLNQDDPIAFGVQDDCQGRTRRRIEGRPQELAAERFG